VVISDPLAVRWTPTRRPCRLGIVARRSFNRPAAFGDPANRWSMSTLERWTLMAHSRQ
jgi:hypothetical protein